MGSNLSSTQKKDKEDLECDYEKCTRLYKRLESASAVADWEAVGTFLDTGTWPDRLWADKVGPQEQSMTWVTLVDPKDESVLLWSRLPLHIAIARGAPFSVIYRLVEMSPESIKCVDDKGVLPIHLALSNGSSNEVVDYLLLQFPESVHVQDRDGLTPTDKILDLLFSKGKNKVSNRKKASKDRGKEKKRDEEATSQVGEHREGSGIRGPANTVFETHDDELTDIRRQLGNECRPKPERARERRPKPEQLIDRRSPPEALRSTPSFETLKTILRRETVPVPESIVPVPPTSRPSKYEVGGKPQWARKIRKKKEISRQTRPVISTHRTLIRD